MTKPIELGAKKAETRGDLTRGDLKRDLPHQTKIEKLASSKGRKEAIVVDQRCEAEIMRLNPPRARKASAKPEIINQIGQCLGRVYNDVLKQPVPDRFLELLQTLETGAPASSETQAPDHNAPGDVAVSSARTKEQK